MNYFVTLRDLVEHGETYKTVLASAPNEVAAATEATHFASTVGWTREENIDVCSTVPAPPNAYAFSCTKMGLTSWSSGTWMFLPDSVKWPLSMRSSRITLSACTLTSTGTATNHGPTPLCIQEESSRPVLQQ